MRIGITGHRGLPEEAGELVHAALRAEMRNYRPDDLVGVSCIADGPDAWFAQSVLDHGGRIEVVVPCNGYRDSLPEWHHATYDELMEQAAQVHHAGLDASDPQAHMVGGEILVGLIDHLIAVWDGEPARGYGGTADVVAYAQRTAVPVRVVWPQGVTRLAVKG
ncbi:hypothetical protein [Streptomyces gobiensis]|uniref:hypothetical protein n=1 Tax=Streptomyces gobiensis TaxID=2875706 RepID=UPI001E629B0D|nr:hypothetical protein [Streptomyces gobiensis]UGY92891.1 hypothetical protein test1122_15035 [Streptomyces gobiensis]